MLDLGPQCRRCRADLSLLFTLEDQRRHALAAAYQCFARSDWPGMLALARQVHFLRRDEESARLLACASLLERDFAAAWQIYSLQWG
jgi:hypothetical protein